MSSPSALTPSDADVRERTLDPTRSFIVQAPAGSGKTELLMQRFLTVLAEVAEPESVLAITFTRKAASEMRNRILEALESAQQTTGQKLPAHKQKTRVLALKVLARDRERGWGLLQTPSRLQVRTVDSFCDSLVRQIPFRSGLGAAADVNPDPQPLYEEAARRTVLMLGDPDERVAGSMAELLSHLDNDLGKVQRLIVGMLQKREQWLRLMGRTDRLDEQELRSVRERLETALVDSIRYELGILRNAVEEAITPDIRKQLVWYMRFAGSNLDPEIPLYQLRDLSDFPGVEPEDVSKWMSIYKFFFDSKGRVRGSLDRRHGFPREKKVEKEACLELLAQLGSNNDFTGRVFALLEKAFVLPPASYTDQQWGFIKALFCLLPRAVAHLKLVFAEGGSVDFSEVAQAAALALGTSDDPTDLALALGARIQHILVDEFQDTSVVQIELLKALMATWDQGSGNTIFVVGDPMQSIYGFREAEVVLFQRTREAGINGRELKPEELRVNFRSQSRLIDWFNEAFPYILTEDNQVTGAVGYSRADAIHPAGPEPVSVHPFLVKDYEAEGRVVADLVEKALGEDEKGKVAILVRARPHLKDIVHALQARKIRFRAVKIDSLAERQAVLDVDALTRALLHPEDRTAWLAILRAPWCGLELSDLWVLCRDDRYSPVWDLLQQRKDQLSEAGRKRVERIMPVLADALACRGRVPLRLWVESTWISLGGPAAVRAGENRAADLRDSRAYFGLLQELEKAGELPDPQTVRRKLEELYSPADTADDIRVEIMTIHNAKGLEFDTVIVPGLGRRPKPDDPRLLYWRERVLDGRVQLLLAPIGAVSSEQTKDRTVERYLRQLDRDRTHEEMKRLLYVAATRAKRKLHLLGHVDEAGAEPDGSSLLSILFSVPEVNARFASAQQDVASNVRPTRDSAEESDGLDPHSLRRLPVEWTLPEPPTPLSWNRDASPAQSEDERHTFRWVSETLRRVGTVAHSFLQQMGRDRLEGWEERRIHERVPAIRAALLESGVPAGDIDSACDKVVKTLLSALQDENGLWILGPRSEARSEFELSGVIDDRVRRAKIDRTFVEDGTRWIIDYKVTDIEGGSKEKFLAAQVEKYRSEMETYRRLMSALDTRPIRCALYFALQQELKQL